MAMNMKCWMKISDQPGNKDLLVYPGEEEEEYEFEVMEPVKRRKV